MPLSVGAGEGNRTLVVSLGSSCSTIELHPQSQREILTAFCSFVAGCRAPGPQKISDRRSAFRAGVFPPRGISRYKRGMKTRKPNPEQASPAGSAAGRKAGAQDIASRCGAYRDRRILARSAGGHRPDREAQGGASGAEATEAEADEAQAQEEDPCRLGSHPSRPGAAAGEGEVGDPPARTGIAPRAPARHQQPVPPRQFRRRDSVAAALLYMRQTATGGIPIVLAKLRTIVEDPRTERVIMTLIIINAVTLGLQTSQDGDGGATGRSWSCSTTSSSGSS